MSQSLWKRSRLLIIVLIGLVVAFACLSIGLVDGIVGLISRPHMLARLDIAVQADPPRVEYLFRAIRGGDWYVAAGAAERVAGLRREGRLQAAEGQVAVETLMEALSSRGHWWRFGWDREEADFEQFRSAAVDAVASFGQSALPSVEKALSTGNSSAREAACWILVTMLEQGLVDREAATAGPLGPRIKDLAAHDPEYGVRNACECLRVRAASE